MRTAFLILTISVIQTKWLFGACATTATAWANTAFTQQTGNFEVTFTGNANASGTDALISISSFTIATYTDSACSVLFAPTNVIQARNAGAYAADVVTPYVAGSTYSFRMVVDIPSHTYDVFITSTGAEFQLANDFGFRTEQAAANELDNYGIKDDAQAAIFCDFSITPPAEDPVIPASVYPGNGQLDMSSGSGTGVIQ